MITLSFFLLFHGTPSYMWTQTPHIPGYVQPCERTKAPVIRHASERKSQEICRSRGARQEYADLYRDTTGPHFCLSSLLFPSSTVPLLMNENASYTPMHPYENSPNVWLLLSSDGWIYDIILT